MVNPEKNLSLRPTEGRISQRRSGFTENSFVIVYKMSDGTYTTPSKIPRGDAMAIAKQYAQRRTVDPKYNVSLTTAEFIYKKARELGAAELVGVKPVRKSLLLPEDSLAAMSSVDSMADDPATAATEIPVQVKPRFFPMIEADVMPELANDVIENIAFVLAGVAPEQRKNENAIRSQLTLKKLVRIATAKVSPGTMLRTDHWYVLYHMHRTSEKEFAEQWENAQTQAKGQGNTDMVKLMHRLERFEIDAAAKCLVDPLNREFFLQVREKQSKSYRALLAEQGKRSSRYMMSLIRNQRSPFFSELDSSEKSRNQSLMPQSKSSHK